MSFEKSLKNSYVILLWGITITSITLIFIMANFIRSLYEILSMILFILLIIGWNIVFVLSIRRKIILFSSELCQNLDDMMNGKSRIKRGKEEETLLSKINNRLVRLYEVMQEHNRKLTEEKNNLQELVSDISHQVKMPIANLKMLNATLLEQKVKADQEQVFFVAMDGQIHKLDFFMQSMLKISRLEMGAITLSPKLASVYETLAAALGGIVFEAEKKNLSMYVDCSEDLKSLHDSKWTAEAIFNILDNAVKYTSEGGRIQVTAAQWEMYTQIVISDNGMGILEEHQAAVFKRFYREERVHDIDGIGIGLYLARQIITRQGGHIVLKSEVGKGSEFSIYLPNR